MQSIIITERLIPPEQIAIFHLVTEQVAKLATRNDLGRCHELARAIGQIHGLQVQDGYYGYVEHSWCWMTPWMEVELGYPLIPNLLDVYAVGKLPMVQLHDMQHASLGHVHGYRRSH